MTVTVPLWAPALALVGAPTGALLGVFFDRWWQRRHVARGDQWSSPTTLMDGRRGLG